MMIMIMMMCPAIQADNHQEHLVLAEAKKLDADGLVNFISINELRYITEYNQVVSKIIPVQNFKIHYQG